ncbi:oncostatin-M [Dromiciops gliroides]|uniref:oncostatin-M n=1 Tax=Dromiciops gliroides TaxID=33562 RepID=UPI001CC5024D|nr:oncostatin-M [Dromiciops gliroides]
MWARLRLSSLFGLTCGLLWLCPVARSTCADYHTLLQQLKNLAKTDFLTPFMANYIVNASRLANDCKKIPDFLMTETLADLPPVTFLQTVSQTLHLVEQKLEMNLFERMIRQIQGINNNIYCMLRTLTGDPTPCLPPRSKEAPSIGANSGFLWKKDRCQLIQGYQSFMQAVRQVLETWGASPGQRNRNRRSLLKALVGQRRRVRAG